MRDGILYICRQHKYHQTLNNKMNSPPFTITWFLLLLVFVYVSYHDEFGRWIDMPETSVSTHVQRHMIIAVGVLALMALLFDPYLAPIPIMVDLVLV